MLFLSQNLTEIITKDLNKSILTKGFPYAVNHVSSFERYSSIYKLQGQDFFRYVIQMDRSMKYMRELFFCLSK